MIKQILSYTASFILFFIVSGSLYADVTATGSQSPQNPVSEGENPVYTITVTNLDPSSPTFPNITILLGGVDVSAAFTSSSCSLDGIFFCNQLNAGTSTNHQFQWSTPPLAGDYALTFVVACSGRSCSGNSVAITTSVMSEPVTPPPAVTPPDFTVSLNSTNEGGNSTFSGVLLETSCAKVGVVLYHGRGLTPRSAVIEEMRTSLYRAGYSTLSIENPLPLNGQTDFLSYVNDVSNDNYVFPEAYARMRTAINHLQSLGVEEVVVAGFSLGSRLATAHVARGQMNELPILGLLGVGMYGNSIDPLNVAKTLGEVTVPVLDLYGDADTDAVDTAAARLAAYNSGIGLDYTQIELACIPGLNCHQLEGLSGDDNMPLEVNVNAWMQAVAPASLVPDCTPSVVPSSGDSSALNVYLTLLFLLLLPVLRTVRRGN